MASLPHLPALLCAAGEGEEFLVGVYDRRVVPDYKLVVLHGCQHVDRVVPANTAHHGTYDIIIKCTVSS